MITVVLWLYYRIKSHMSVKREVKRLQNRGYFDEFV